MGVRLTDHGDDVNPQLVFAFASQGSVAGLDARMGDLAGWLSARAKIEMRAHASPSYEKLANLIHRSKVDLGWLPPIVFMHVDREHLMVPLLTSERAGSARFHAVLVVRADSKVSAIADLRGKRVAWVDPWSAAGYVVPRMYLPERGLDPQRDFADERFWGSHEAAVRAVLAGYADVAATFAHCDDSGQPLDGGWSQVDAKAFRVVCTFGAIPPDVIAASASMPEERRDALRAALIAAATEESTGLVRAIFGAERFRVGMGEGYDTFRRAARSAFKQGLLDGIATR